MGITSGPFQGIRRPIEGGVAGPNDAGKPVTVDIGQLVDVVIPFVIKVHEAPMPIQPVVGRNRPYHGFCEMSCFRRVAVCFLTLVVIVIAISRVIVVAIPSFIVERSRSRSYDVRIEAGSWTGQPQGERLTKDAHENCSKSLCLQCQKMGDRRIKWRERPPLWGKEPQYPYSWLVHRYCKPFLPEQAQYLVAPLKNYISINTKVPVEILN